MPTPSSSHIHQHFAVLVHDVVPAFLPRLETITNALAPRVGLELAAAVVPCWHGRPIDGPGSGFTQFVTTAFVEVLQHGYTHRQDRPGLLSLFTGRSDELLGLPRHEVRRRIVLGREVLQQTLGAAPAGFVPPAWQLGPATSEPNSPAATPWSSSTPTPARIRELASLLHANILVY